MTNWEKRKLGDVCGFVRGPFGGSLKKNIFKADGYAVYEQQHAIYDQFEDIRYFIDEEKFNEMKRFELNAGDIIMSCSGTMGKIAIVPENIKKGIINQALLKLTPSKRISNHFLKLWMQSQSFQDSLKEYSQGAAIQNVASVAILKSIEVPLPSITEQYRIVSILDESFTAISKAKANAEQNLKNAKELFESYLQGVFENRSLSGVEGKGEGWEERTLNQISDNLDSKRVPVTKNVRNEGVIPYYGASGIVDYVSDYLFDEDLLCVSEDGANLLARTYPIAFSITGKTWVNNHAHILRFKNMVNQKFVELYLNSIKLDDFVSGMAQPKLNQTMLNRIPIPFPPFNQQKTIVHKVEELSAETKKLVGIYQKKIADLEELKKSILQKAFSGELKFKTYE
jgi:type I restriction enzyme S subunit